MAQIEETIHFNIHVDMPFHAVKYLCECDVHMTEYNFYCKYLFVSVLSFVQILATLFEEKLLYKSALFDKKYLDLSFPSFGFPCEVSRTVFGMNNCRVHAAIIITRKILQIDP